MVRWTFGLLLIFFLAMGLSIVAGAGLATVDYSILLAFHPAMARYDFTFQRFFLPETNLSDPAKMEQIRKKMGEKALAGQTTEVEVDRDRQRVIREMQQLEIGSRQTISNMLKENKDVGSFQRTYSFKQQELNNRLAELDRRYLDAQEAGLELLYLSREKSDQFLAKVFQEIDRHLAAVSQERGGVAIVDRSFMAPPAVTLRPAPPIGDMDISTADLYNQLLGFSFAQPPAGSGPPGHMERVVEGVESRFKDSFQRYLSQAPALRPVVANLRGRMVLAGGEDLTGTVLGRVLDAYGTNPDVKARLLQYVAQLN